MKLTERQLKIIEIVKENEPVSGDKIAQQLGLSRATLRSDFSVLTMTGVLDARPKVGYFYSGQSLKPLLFEKMYEVSVKEIMIPPIMVDPELSVYDAATNLFMYDVGSLYVKNKEQELLGVISRKDFLRFMIGNAHAEKTPVAMIMTRMPNIFTITPEWTVLEAGNLLIQHQVDSLPVLESVHSKRVVGKVTKTRIMHHFVHTGNAAIKDSKEI